MGRIIMTKFSDSEKKITASDITRLEKKLSLKFPQSYKNHLLTHNGGRCKPNVFSFVENGKQTESAIGWFFSVKYGDTYNLYEVVKDYKTEQNRVPVDFLPIADDPLGNLICIDTQTEKIYFWDHETEPSVTGNPDMWSNVYWIADSLDEFFAGLISDEEILEKQQK